ncbi:hypothetical protein [Halomicrobium salinisoli]|uniref:hypothetical protein n=1 Tax=Halomicrobium salinisoli TaxID=2878391 RepID=UPI001CF05026|nr:hypothetical protein [Halomicrobium salinisoli]
MDRYWDDDEVDHFITSEAHTARKTPAQFKETHVDIDRIYAETLTPLGVSDDYVTQEDLLKSITASTIGGPDSEEDSDPNRIFIVRGEPGSGKSQLCEWTKYQINGYGEDDEGIEDYVALHVSRSQTRMDQIIDILTEPLDIDPDVKNIDELDPDDAASAIVEYMRGIWSTEHFTDKEIQELTDERGDESDLRTIFAKNIQEYQDALDSRDENPDFNLLTRADFRDLRLQLSFSDKLTENKDLLYSVLKNEAHEYLSRNLVGDFKEQLQEYSQQYKKQGIRPVLICEDLTTFSVLKEQLLDHIFELSSSHYDIVLGWTIGWEQDNIDDAMARSDAAKYMKGRTKGYLTMTNESGEAYFLDDDASVELTRSYLDAIKRHSDAGSPPDNVEMAFDGLYPFNEQFVHVAYRQLNDEGSDRKTPRLLLLRVMKHCLKSTLPPYEAMKSNSFVDTPAFDVDMQYDQIYQDISRWYGVPVDGGIGVKTGIFEAFGVDLPDSDEATVKGDYVVFEKGKGSDLIDKIKNPPTPEHELEDDDDDSDGGDDDGGGDRGDSSGDDDGSDGGNSGGGAGGAGGGDDDELSEEEREGRRKFQEFQDWVTNGEEYPSSDTLHEGAVEVLERCHNPTRLGNPNASTRSASAIYYARGDSIPVSIQGDQQRQANIDIELEWGDEYADLYTPMVEYGLFGTFDTTDTNFDQLRAWADTNVAQFKHDMREEIESCLPETLSIEKTLVLGQIFLLNAAKGVQIGEDDLSAELVFEDYELDQPYGKPIAEEFDPDSAFGQAFAELTKSSSEINDLIEGFFLLKSNVVDYERLAEVRREIAEDFEAHVDDAMMIDAGDIPDAYKIGSTRNSANTNVATLFRRIANYASELQRLTAEDDADHIQEALEPVERWYDSSHTVDDLADWFETLEKCRGVFDVGDKQIYEDARELLGLDAEDLQVNIQLTSFRDDIERFQNMDGDTGTALIARLHDFARSRHEQDAWTVYQALDTLIEELQDQEHSTGVDLEHRIQQLTEYSEYEQKRQEVISITEDL